MVRTLFEQKIQGPSRTHFPFFKDSIQCKKEPWVYVFFSSTTTWAILSWRSFILGTWESGLDKVSTEIQGLSSTDCNFQGLKKVRANPVNSRLGVCFLCLPTNQLEVSRKRGFFFLLSRLDWFLPPPPAPALQTTSVVKLELYWGKFLWSFHNQ